MELVTIVILVALIEYIFFGLLSLVERAGHTGLMHQRHLAIRHLNVIIAYNKIRLNNLLFLSPAL